MNSWILASTLLLGSTSVENFDNAEIATASIEQELETGSLIFTRGDCLAIRIYTSSPYTHVAAVVREKSGPVIYDSMNGVGVRRLPLKEYLNTQKPDVLHIVHPTHAFTTPQKKAFEKHLHEKLGTPYSVSHYLTGKRVEGLHCAEYVTDALSSCSLMQAECPPKVSPASLLEGALSTSLYQPVRTFSIQPPKQEVAQGEGWCTRMWIETRDCTYDCLTKVRKMVCCH